MKTKGEKLCKKDENFLVSLGIGVIGRENISKKEIVDVLRRDKDFQKEVHGFFT